MWYSLSKVYCFCCCLLEYSEFSFNFEIISFSITVPSRCLERYFLFLSMNLISYFSVFLFIRNQRKSQTLYQLQPMEHQFQNLKPFLKMEAQWRHRTKLLFWKALVLSVLMKNGLHYLSAGSVRNLVMRCAICSLASFIS